VHRSCQTQHVADRAELDPARLVLDLFQSQFGNYLFNMLRLDFGHRLA